MTFLAYDQSIYLKCYVFQSELCDVKAILYMTCLLWGYSALVQYSIPTVTVFLKLFKLDNFWKSFNKPVKFCSRYQNCNISSILSLFLYCRMIIVSCIELAVHWAVVLPLPLLSVQPSAGSSKNGRSDTCFSESHHVSGSKHSVACNINV